jgi:hypothetical protein
MVHDRILVSIPPGMTIAFLFLQAFHRCTSGNLFLLNHRNGRIVHHICYKPRLCRNALFPYYICRILHHSTWVAAPFLMFLEACVVSPLNTIL